MGGRDIFNIQLDSINILNIYNICLDFTYYFILVLVVTRKLISIRQSLTSDGSSHWAFKKQIGKLKVDSRVYLGTCGHGGDIKKQVSGFVFNKPREKKEPTETNSNPFILKVSREDGKTSRLGPDLLTYFA